METNGNTLETFRKHPGDCKSHPRFVCMLCDYKTSRLADWTKHISTRKHKKVTNVTNPTKCHKYKKQPTCSFCGRPFQSRSGKWKHEKKCAVRELQRIKQEHEKELAVKNAVIETQAKALQKTQTINNNIGRDQNNTTVNNITINCFLNDKCKNAPDVMEFIKDNIQFTLANIDPDRPNSTIEALGDMMGKACKAGDSTMRPIHCSDEKRQTFYIKDASGWAKDVDNKKIDKAIGWANMRHQATWHEKAKKEGLAKAANDTDYLKTNVAMGTWSDDVKKSKAKVKRILAKNLSIKEAMSEDKKVVNN